MGTQRTTGINDVGFVHFGLEEGIRDALTKLPAPCEVILQGNIDGLPLFKSLQVCFWPISCKVTNCGDSAPFIVSLFCGKGKTPCLESYLRPFLEEVQALTKDGLIFKGTNVPVTLSAMICDAPARSFVKPTIGHTGYYACELCTVRGVYMDGKVTYPHLTSPLRTDSSFRAQEDKHHHKGTSPFTCLDGDLVAFFPTDYMHLVCLDNSLRACAMNFPLQFQRRPRGTDELDRWKAAEFPRWWRVDRTLGLGLWAEVPMPDVYFCVVLKGTRQKPAISSNRRDWGRTKSVEKGLKVSFHVLGSSKNPDMCREKGKADAGDSHRRRQHRISMVCLWATASFLPTPPSRMRGAGGGGGGIR
ncbi:hypothetical protein HPB47_013433 [Ixodes persulcatus]|uniref:Uncharacterized protein n=1 Tax=Ixodes persulcatus TaxID=34615 RepID=A0AC60QYH0_IXOPE|nr:hypothetical protein HPB47_013433 [Ixodes persulcatus]